MDNNFSPNASSALQTQKVGFLRVASDGLDGISSLVGITFKSIIASFDYPRNVLSLRRRGLAWVVIAGFSHRKAAQVVENDRERPISVQNLSLKTGFFCMISDSLDVISSLVRIIFRNSIAFFEYPGNVLTLKKKGLSLVEIAKFSSKQVARKAMETSSLAGKREITTIFIGTPQTSEEESPADDIFEADWSQV